MKKGKNNWGLLRRMSNKRKGMKKIARGKKRRLKLILKSTLNGKNRVVAI